MTHEPDIAKCATRNIIFKDGLILRESVVADKINAGEMLASIPIEAD